MNLLGDVLNIVPETDGGFHSIRMAVRQLAVTGRLPTRATGDKEAVKLLVELQGGGAWQDIDGSYELPHSWCWARFNQVAEIASNLVPPSKFMDVPHVAPDNIEKGTGRLLPYRIIREDGVTSGKHRFFPGQILYSKIRPNLSKAVTVDFEGLCSADMYPLSPRIDRGYLHLFLLSPVFLAQVVREDNRLAMPKVNQEQLSATVVAVPPLPEQKRIVAKVDQLMGLIDELEAKQNKKRDVQTRFRTSALDALTKANGPEELASAWKRVAGNFGTLFERVESVAVLRNLILESAFLGRLSTRDNGDDEVPTLLRKIDSAWSGRRTKDPLPNVVPEEIPLSPEHWAWVRLGNLAEVVGGVTKGRDLRGRKVRSFPYLRVANVQRGFLDLGVMKEIDIPEEELPKYRLLPGDVLFTEGGDWDKLGRSTLWRGEIDPCIHQNHVFRARMVASELDPAWFSSFANSPLGRRYFEDAAKQTTNLASINMTQLKNCPMPIPSLAEQRRIVAKVEALMKLCDDLEAKLRAKEETAGKLVEAVVKELVA